MTDALSPAPSNALTVTVHAAGGVSMLVPAIVADAGERAARKTLEFFTARIANAHTRETYGRAVFAFCAWCDARGVALQAIDAPTVAAYLQGLQVNQRRRGTPRGAAAASVKVTASALRHWMDYLTENGVLTHNPALSVRTQRLVVSEGKTPVMEREEGRTLFDALDAGVANDGDILLLRDRAMFAVMLFGFVRVGALCKMAVRDFEDEGATAYLVLHEKGGKERRIACHHKAREYLRAYVQAAGFDSRSHEPLFQSAPKRSGALSGKAMGRIAVWKTVKRRCKAAGLPSSISNHSFRATGLTLHQLNGGKLEDAQEMAGHADARTTRLYVRKSRKIAQAEFERVQL
jgi:integrase/recombinase XerD